MTRDTSSTVTTTDELLLHLLGPMLRSAVALVGDGVAAAADVDLAMRLGARHHLGPLEYLRALDADERQVALGSGQAKVPAPAGDALDANGPTDTGASGVPWTDAPVGVVGSGFMAAGIAYAIATAGQEVVLLSRSPQAADFAIARIAGDLDRAVGRGRLAEADAGAARGRVRATPDLTTLYGARLVIEAVAEDLAIKQEVFARLDAELASAELLATNTSSLLVGDIASATRRPERVAGLHFFSPVPAMKLVEVVGTPAVADADVARGMAWARSLGKVPVRCADRPGFIVNSLLIPFLNDAVRAHEDGRATIAEIDDVLTARAGHPMGPFQLLDLIGLDVSLAAQCSMFAAAADERLRPARLLIEMVEGGLLGRKSGRGFYDYSGGGT